MTPVSTSVRYVTPEGTVTLAGYDMLRGLQERLDGAGGVLPPVGGGVVDIEARAAIAAIIAAMGG